MPINSVFLQRNALRWLIWASVVLALVGFFLAEVNRNEAKITRTKAVVIGKVIQQRINELHKSWLLNKQPKFLNIDNTLVKFDSNGWVELANYDRRDCNHLLSVVYKGDINKTNGFFVKSEEIAPNSYSCLYGINSDIEIKIHKIRSLRVEVIFLT